MNDTWRRAGYLISLAAMIGCGAIAVTGGPWLAIVLLAGAAVTSFHVADR